MSLAAAHLIFVVLAGAGMLVLGCSYLTLTAWPMFMVAALLLIVGAVWVWLRALRQVCGVAAQLQDGRLSMPLLVRLYFVLPELLNQTLAGRAGKRVDRALPYSMVVFCVALVTAALVAPQFAPTVLLALVLVMLRQLHQWRRAVVLLTSAPPDTARDDPSAAMARKPLPFSLELLGVVVLNLLLAVVVVVLFNAFLIVPFDGQLARAQQKLVEMELKQALQFSAAYLQAHPKERLASLQQLTQAGWRETAQIRLLQVDMTATEGVITMRYQSRPGSRRDPVTVKLVYDQQGIKTERMH